MNKHAFLLILFLISSTCFCLLCKGDSLFVSKKFPNAERILIFDNKYFIKVNLYLYPDKDCSVNITHGLYSTIKNRINFCTGCYDSDGLFSNRYIKYLEGMASPDLNMDAEDIVKELFGFTIPPISVYLYGSKFKGRFKKHSIFCIGSKKYSISSKLP